MMKAVGKYAAVLLLLCCTLSCHKDGRIIPPAKLTDIYVEMFLADQWLSDNPRARRGADTSDFYGAIFERYGYSFKDYDASVRHYLCQPEKFADITTNAAKRLEDMYADAKKELARQEAVISFEKSLPPYKRVDFAKDTILHISFPCDSVSVDTVATDMLLPDSLAVAVSLLSDSTSVSIQLDSNVTRRDSIRADLQPKAGQLLRNKPVARERKDL